MRVVRQTILYRTILADPPWDVSTQRGGHGAERHYPLMRIEAVAALRVDRLVGDNAHLWLWVTNAHWREQSGGHGGVGLQLPLVPHVDQAAAGPRQLPAQPNRASAVRVRGKAPIRFRGQGTWLYAPVQAHSHKPEEQYAVIERCSPGPYLELFARAKRPGWHAWGNEVDCDVAP